MAQLVVRNLEQSVKTRLQRRAKRNRHSMEAEIRDILREAVKTDSLVEKQVGLGTRIRRRFAGMGLDLDIPEFKGQEVRPPAFDEK